MTQDVTQAAEQLLERQKTLQLATLNGDGEPESSYAPCLVDRQQVYLFLSQLASHTQNLLRVPDCSLMWIADEKDSRNLFARERLILKCRAVRLPPEADDYRTVMEKMEARLGPTLRMLRSLPDFQLFQLAPLSGRFIQGFGAAYTFDGFNLSSMTAVTGR